MSACTQRAGSTVPWSPRRLVVLIGALIAVAGTVLNPATAHAHTAFESSTPAAGSTVDQPVDLVTIVFTGEADPVGDQFIALTPAGVLQRPVSIATDDNKVFSVLFDPPLAGGEVGLRWHVQAADAHPIEGAFSFTVDAPAPTTTPPTTTPPTTTPPTTTRTTSESTTPASTTPASTARASGTSSTVLEAVPTPSVTAPAAPSAQTLDEFLAVDNAAPGETTATIGRLVGFLGVILGLGAFAFVATTLRGRRDEIRSTITAIRVLGLVIVLGAAIEYVGVTRIAGESLSAGWTTGPGFATVLRAIGAIGLAVGMAGTISTGSLRRTSRRPSVGRSLSAAVIDDVESQPDRAGDDGSIMRWSPDSRSWLAVCGTLLIIASFWFDGHTVSKGFRPFHALVNSVHVAAGAVWAGGVVTMAAVVWSRFRHHRPMRVVELVVRFSKIATVALGAVVAAGGLMAVLVLDSFGELTGTPWGKILLLKTAGVALALVAGAYNHFRLLPALEADPESPELLAELRSIMIAEAIMLVFVVTVTAWLVSAAS